MAFDIKKTVTDIVEKIQKDPDILANFQKDPIKTVEKIAGVDLPDDQLQPVVDAVRAKLAGDKAGDIISGVTDAIGGIFNKK